jgi:phospholipase A1
MFSPARGMADPSNEACRQLLDATERLACYDEANGAPKGAVAVEDLSHLQRLLKRRAELEHDRFALTPYRPNYVLAGTYNADADFDVYDQLPIGEDELNDLQDYEIKMQFSIRTVLWPNVLGTGGNLAAAYTQQNYWQAYSDDAPFRETDHEPELLLEFPMSREVLGMQLRSLTLSLNHHSNGSIEPISRSWNRVIGIAVFERGNMAMSVRPWWRIEEDDEDDDNPHIERYMGQMELGLGYRWHEHSFTAFLKNNLRSDNKSGLQIDWSFPLAHHLRGYVQYYTGYGENLIDGENETNRIGAGFMLTDWY